MSQHRFSTEHNGERVEVLMGWDRPLQRFFLVVERIDSDVFDEAPYLYDNLGEPNADDLTIDDIRNVLAHIGLAVPESMFHECLRDRANNTGNRIEHHTL